MKNYVTITLMVEKDAANEVIVGLDKACQEITGRLYEAASTLRYAHKPSREGFDTVASLSEQMVRLQDAVDQIREGFEEDCLTEEEIPFGD